MRRYLLTTLPALALLGLSACSTAPTTEVERDRLLERADTAIESFLDADPSMEDFFDTAEAWVVFPSVGKGGAGIGGAYGKGVLYESGDPVGFADLTQGTIGFQLGGQSYREIIFFEGDDTVEDFKQGNFAFSAQASAVAATAGASADANYKNGVAVFTMERGGLMYEASIGGQKFDYVPR